MNKFKHVHDSEVQVEQVEPYLGVFGGGGSAQGAAGARDLYKGTKEGRGSGAMVHSGSQGPVQGEAGQNIVVRSSVNDGDADHNNNKAGDLLCQDRSHNCCYLKRVEIYSS